MNIILLTIIAALCNIGTIACIKKCKHAVLSNQPMWVWLLGIAVTILATEFLLLRADIKGASLGLVVSVVIVSVMIAAAFMGIHEDSGRLLFSLKHSAPLELCGYILAVSGVMLIGISQQMHSVKAGSDASATIAISGQ